jgi:tripartite-type tricarboxylate transporter receptor subunit TctC
LVDPMRRLIGAASARKRDDHRVAGGRAGARCGANPASVKVNLGQQAINYLRVFSMKRRQLLTAGLGSLAVPSILRAPAALAQPKYPDHPIRLVIPFAPAGPTDIIGRKVAEKMTGIMGQTWIVDNKAGAAGSIGAVEVKNAKPDGYTLLFATSSTHAINPTAYAKPLYDALKDFTPVSSICVNPAVLAARMDMPDTVMGLVDLMKKNPGKYSYGSSGTGSIFNLAGEYFKGAVGGMDVEHIPYKGSAPALNDMMSGQIAWMFDTFATMLPLHRAGKIRILAVAYSSRSPVAPEIPTMIEAGVKGYEAYTFNLILGPANMPKSIVDTLDQASRKLLADADMVKFLNDLAAPPTPNTSPELTEKFITDEIAKWAPVIKTAGIRVE